EQATMKEAIEEMSGKGLGMTTVVDGEGRPVAAVTDGDLRRQQLAHGATLLERRAAECMTRGPKVIGADELAAKALAMMEGRITSLVIVDEAGRPAGVIHLHDILRGSRIPSPRQGAEGGPPRRRHPPARHPAREDRVRAAPRASRIRLLVLDVDGVLQAAGVAGWGQ